MSSTCEKCSGTGMLPGSEYLDCASCDVAMIRVGLETWARLEGMKVDLDELWAIFKYGQSVALEKPASIPHSMLVHAVAGITFTYSNEGFALASVFEKLRLLRTETSGHGGINVDHYWDRVALAKLSDEQLLAIYNKVSSEPSAR